jgi:predicted lipoprotein with Yx(FWY)xxD motif
MKANLFRPFLASIAVVAVQAIGAIPAANVSAQMPGYMGPQMGGYPYSPYSSMTYPYTSGMYPYSSSTYPYTSGMYPYSSSTYPYSSTTYPYVSPSYTYTSPTYTSPSYTTTAYVVSSPATYPSIQISGVYPAISSYSSTYSTPSSYTTSSSYSTTTYGYVTSSVTVSTNATLGPILTDGRGMTMYTLSSDTAGSSTCSNTCVTVWPPALAPSPSSSLNVSTGVSGTFGSTTRSDGSLQLTYNGKPLYFFSHDSVPGDTNGQGVTDDFGHWTVAQP